MRGRRKSALVSTLSGICRMAMFGPHVAPQEGSGAGVRSARVRLELAMCTGGVPALLAGDFNAELEDHPVQVAFATQGWQDPVGMVPTCAGAPPLHPHREISRTGAVGIARRTLRCRRHCGRAAGARAYRVSF